MTSFRLRFERVGIEGGHVVLDVEVMKPVEIMQHETRSKSCGTPLIEILIDPPGVLIEVAAGLVESPVVPKIMNANFEALADEFLPQLRRHSVIAFRNKVEGRSEAQFTLEFGQSPAFRQARRPFHVMSKHECKLLTLRPPAPRRRLLFRSRHDRPAGSKSLP